MGKDHIRQATYGSSRGQDIGILPGGWVVLGGKQFYLSRTAGSTAKHERVSPGRPDPVHLGTQGYPDLIVLSKANGERSGIPGWDAKETLLLGTKARRVGPTLCSHLGDILAAEVAAIPFNAAAAAKGILERRIAELDHVRLPPGEQRPVLPDALKRSNFLTPLLAGNAVVFLSGDVGNWHVVAVEPD